MTNVVDFRYAFIARGAEALATAECNYKEAGRRLKALKTDYALTRAEWKKVLKTKIGISPSRASDLMQFADGHMTIVELLARKRS